MENEQNERETANEERTNGKNANHKMRAGETGVLLPPVIDQLHAESCT